MKTTQIALTQEEQIQQAIDKGKKKYGKVYKTVLHIASCFS